MNGKTKIVGNSLKSSTLQAYIEKTFNKSIELLLHGKGKEFIELYYEQLTRIYNKEIPLVEIANKARVKQKVADYQKDLKTKVNKNGRGMARKAYMELLIEADLSPDLGKNIYYVNNGTKKSHGDLGNSYLIDEMDFISHPEKTGDYNVPRYVDLYNKRMVVFLSCFSPEVRETLIVNDPEKRSWYTDKQMELVSGQPIKDGVEDVLFVTDLKDYEEYKERLIQQESEDSDKEEQYELKFNEPLFEMSEREVLFWNRSESDPRAIFTEFTTLLSRVPLLTQEQKAGKKIAEQKIIDYFKENEIEVKREAEYVVDQDLIIKYGKIYHELDEDTLTIKDRILPKEEWILSKYEYGSYADLEVITEEIYI